MQQVVESKSGIWAVVIRYAVDVAAPQTSITTAVLFAEFMNSFGKSENFSSL